MGKCVSILVVVPGGLLMLFPRLQHIQTCQDTWGTEGGYLTLTFSAHVGWPSLLERWTPCPHILSNRCLSLELGWFGNFERLYSYVLGLLDGGRAAAWYLCKRGSDVWQCPSFRLQLFKNAWIDGLVDNQVVVHSCQTRGGRVLIAHDYKVNISFEVYPIKRKWSGHTLLASDNPWLQTSSEVMVKSTTGVWWSKGTHRWLDRTWFERIDRPGWFGVNAFYTPPFAAILWCQFLCARFIEWSPVAGVSLLFFDFISDGSCSAFSARS